MWTAIGLVLSRSGANLERVWRGNPVIRAVVIIAVTLVILDLAARESLSLWKEAATVKGSIDAINAENAAKSEMVKLPSTGSNATPAVAPPVLASDEAIICEKLKRRGQIPQNEPCTTK